MPTPSNSQSLTVCPHCDAEHAPDSPCICATCGLPSHDLAVMNVCHGGGLWLECRDCRFSPLTVAAPIALMVRAGRTGPAGEMRRAS